MPNRQWFAREALFRGATRGIAPTEFNVKAFGAKGDGVTDETTAIQAAITAGKFVVLPAGTYIASDLTGLNGHVISGAGIGQTIIKYAASGTGACLATTLNARNVVLRDLTIDGQGNAAPGVTGLLLNGASLGLLENVEIINFTGTAGTRGRGVRIHAPSLATGQGYFNTFLKVNAVDNGVGIECTNAGADNSANDNTFIGCQCNSNDADGVKVTTTAGTPPAGLIFVGGEYSFNGGDGIDLDGPRHLVLGPALESNGGYGVNNGAGTNPQLILIPGLIGTNTLGNFGGVVPGFSYFVDYDFHTARVFHSIVTFTNLDTTPSVQRGNVFIVSNSGATTITQFDDGLAGQRFTLIAGTGNTTLTHGTNIFLKGGANQVLANGETIEFVAETATVWRQV